LYRLEIVTAVIINNKKTLELLKVICQQKTCGMTRNVGVTWAYRLRFARGICWEYRLRQCWQLRARNFTSMPVSI